MSTDLLSMGDVAVLVCADIDDPTEAATWVATIWAESGGDPVAYNLNDHDPTSRSYLSTDNGLLQINSYWHGIACPVHEANQPAKAWAYAKRIGNVGNGSDWGKWNAYKNGAYLRHLDAAKTAVTQLLTPEVPPMSLLNLPIPPKPTYFGPDGVPPGFTLDLDAFGSWTAGRPKITPRVGVIHTNAASVESSDQGQINWGNASANNTKPHYCVNQPRPVKVLRTDLRAIANSTGSAIEDQYGERDASFWTIAIETADSGTNADPAISDFLTASRFGPVEVPHAELVARAIAYESIVWNIPIVVPEIWNGRGWATHTWPFPYPHFTTVNGKTCPGDKKKKSFREQIMPRAAQLAAAWTAPAPTPAPEPAPEPTPAPTPAPEPPEDTDMITFVRVDGDNAVYAFSGQTASWMQTNAQVAQWAQIHGVSPDVQVLADKTPLKARWLLGPQPQGAKITSYRDFAS